MKNDLGSDPWQVRGNDQLSESNNGTAVADEIYCKQFLCCVFLYASNKSATDLKHPEMLKQSINQMIFPGHLMRYLITYYLNRGIYGEMVIITENGQSQPCSNFRWGYLHFTLHGMCWCSIISLD